MSLAGGSHHGRFDLASEERDSRDNLLKVARGCPSDELATQATQGTIHPESRNDLFAMAYEEAEHSGRDCGESTGSYCTHVIDERGNMHKDDDNINRDHAPEAYVHRLWKWVWSTQAPQVKKQIDQESFPGSCKFLRRIGSDSKSKFSLIIGSRKSRPLSVGLLAWDSKLQASSVGLRALAVTLWAWALGIGLQALSLAIRLSDFGLRACAFKFGSSSFGLRFLVLWLRAWAFGLLALGFRIWASSFGQRASAFQLQASSNSLQASVFMLAQIKFKCRPSGFELQA
ncbi:hypothetical protein AXF42_Ash019548 [Apostasia shenzhenica]|uniref:Uncharacterized protein n=1 Tax=Apostasia shenzhenica TaxID=1088818 RepID=A0A2I0A0D2_9ASPA|nr:hypothetical protein AXF42_Ash019548 [Apostasia shenzhenica]